MILTVIQMFKKSHIAKTTKEIILHVQYGPAGKHWFFGTQF